MKISKAAFGILTIATVLLLLCGASAKGQSSQIYEYGGVTLDIGGNSGMTGSLSVPQFNPALGTLDSVVVDITEVSYQSTVTVSGPDDASGQVNASGSIIVQDPGNNIYLFGNLYGAWEGNFFLPSYASCGGEDVGYTIGPPYPSYDSPAVLSEFTGDGDFSFQVTGSQSVFASYPGVNVDINSATILANADVIYTYTVPEPRTFSLLVVGFGMMLIRRTGRKLLTR